VLEIGLLSLEGGGALIPLSLPLSTVIKRLVVVDPFPPAIRAKIS